LDAVHWTKAVCIDWGFRVDRKFFSEMKAVRIRLDKIVAKRRNRNIAITNRLFNLVTGQDHFGYSYIRTQASGAHYLRLKQGPCQMPPLSGHISFLIWFQF
jgi:hypothetical protein